MASRVRRMPPIKVDEYRWRSPPNDPRLRVRRACATEAMFGIEASNQNGENDFFIAATVHFYASSAGSKILTLRDLERMTQSSLVQLRVSQPQVAVSLSWDKQGKCMLQYRTPKVVDEVHHWAASIVTAEAKLQSPIDMRDQVEEKKNQESSMSNNNAITVYISSPVTALDAALENSEVHYLFRFNHCLFDGIAARQIVAMLFQSLVAEMSDSSLNKYEDIDWKQSASNLPPAFVELMDSEQDLCGPRFDRTVHDHMALMKKKSTLGLIPLQSKPERPQTEFYTFTEAESQSMMSTMGAVLLALMKTDSARNATIFSSISVIDGRRYLKEGYKKGEKPYIASCQAPAIILFENVNELAVSDISSKSELRDKLVKAAGLAKNSFISNVATPFLFAYLVGEIA
ncbi:15-O-acetyltransferase Tri3-domain-containing protein [Trichoderma asperelloides]|nr:15-O-acetyltransferase Tri3-domain-containing protein [Trichoderma asperelloides]